MCFFFSFFLQEWGVSGSEYFHLNMRLEKVELSNAVSGTLGDSARLKYDEDGKPIMQALDKDGSGILDGSIEKYEVSTLLSTGHPLFRGENSSSASST